MTFPFTTHSTVNVTIVLTGGVPYHVSAIRAKEVDVVRLLDDDKGDAWFKLHALSIVHAVALVCVKVCV